MLFLAAFMTENVTSSGWDGNAIYFVRSLRIQWALKTMSARWLPMLSWISRQCVLMAAIGIPLAMLAQSDAAVAADSSPWDGDSRSAMRLVSGSHAGGGGLFRAGVNIRLAAGWKTYWRYPGDSGVPPVFDFSKSENVKSVAVLWPVPHRFEYEGSASIGYTGDVMFPVHVVAENPQRPVTLRLAVDYAVCEKLCIPAHGQAVLELASGSPKGFVPGPTPDDSRLAAAEARVPKPARVGEAAPLGIAAVRREPGQPHPRIVVEVIAPEGPLDLFAEGPAVDWALPLPEPVPGASAGRRWFAFDLDGAPPGVDPTGAALHFTLVSGDNAVEVTAVPK
jgi:DsbC/DsbD-like thiol-disulfide interchange protein